MRLPSAYAIRLGYHSEHAYLIDRTCLSVFNPEYHRKVLELCNFWMRKIGPYKEMNQHNNWLSEMVYCCAILRQVPSLSSLCGATIHFSNHSTSHYIRISSTPAQTPPTIVPASNTFHVETIKKLMKCLSKVRINHINLTHLFTIPNSLVKNESLTLPSTLQKYIKLDDEQQEWIAHYNRSVTIPSRNKELNYIFGGKVRFIWANIEQKQDRYIVVPRKWIMQCQNENEVRGISKTD